MITADTVIRAAFAVWLVCVVMLIGLTVTRRVIVAWLAYLSLRKHPIYRKQSARRWLWIRTLRYADGRVKRRLHS